MKKQELEPKTITKEDGELRILLSELHERLDYAFWQRRRIEESLLSIDSDSLDIELGPETYLMRECGSGDIVTILKFALNRVELQGGNLAKIAKALDKLV